VAEKNTSSPSPVYRFGVFQANLAARELRKHGVRIRLPGQPFCILSMLLERPGEVVTREDMRQRLWASDTFVDFEHSLNSAVKKLRAALGDTPENSRYIETVPRVGYRFIAPVEAIAEARLGVTSRTEPDELGTGSPTQLRDGRARVRRRLAFAAGAALFGALTLLAAKTYSPWSAPRVKRISRITNVGNLEDWALPVTDGSRIYFLEREGGHWNLTQTSLAGGIPQRMNTSLDRNVRILDISPDLTQFLVGTFLMRDTEMAIWTMPVQGGAPRRVGKIMTKFAIWAPDGKHILYIRDSDLVLCEEDGQNSRKLANAPGRVGQPAWSPDGRSLRFSVWNVDAGSTAIWEVAADGTHLKPLFDGATEDCCGRWTPNGKYFVFNSRRDGKANIWAVREERGLSLWKKPQPVQLTSGPNEFGYVVPSLDGKKVFAFQTNPESQVMRLDPKHGTLSPVPGTAHRIPRWCPQGEWVVYDDTEATIWRSRADGSQLLQLTHPPMRAFNALWSPDAKQILFIGQLPGGQLQVYVVSRDGGELKKVFPSDMAEWDARWNPNGKEVVVAATARERANLEEGRALYTIDLVTGRSAKIAGSEGLAQGVYSPDGRRMLGVTGDYHKLMLFDAGSQKWTELLSGTLVSNPTWAADSDSFYYQDLLGENEPIYRFWLKSKKVEQVFDFREQLKSGYFRAAFYSPGPNESFLIVLSRGWADLYALDVDLP
jgi:Tol biopolymer transport system component/DNA-binding winged helix-turn-helix (wHTH) protein